MSRLVHFRRLVLASFGVLGIAVACRAVRPEGQPLGPRPGPIVPVANPVPKPDPNPPGPTGPTFPTPETPSPTPGPITLREVPSPTYQAAAEPAQSPRDAGVDGAPLSDAATLPPTIPDAVPTDASKTLQP